MIACFVLKKRPIDWTQSTMAMSHLTVRPGPDASEAGVADGHLPGCLVELQPVVARLHAACHVSYRAREGPHCVDTRR